MTTIGVEEEFLLVSARTGRLSHSAGSVLEALPAALRQHFRVEFHTSQIETASPVCRDLTERHRGATACAIRGNLCTWSEMHSTASI